jgi:RNA polymerase sigma-70 factor (ECF subfamily)
MAGTDCLEEAILNESGAADDRPRAASTGPPVPSDFGTFQRRRANHLPSMMPDQPAEPVSPTDPELVARMAAGDREAFALLFHRHQRTVYRFALNMTGLTDVADDVTQEVFMALARAAHRYRSEHGALSTYLYGIARHLVRQRDKKSRSRQEVDLGAIQDREVPGRWRDPIDSLAQAERIALLRRAILCLPAHYREAIVLCEIHGLSYDEAATIVGCPLGTIRSRLNRARRLLTEKCRASPAMAEAGDAQSPVPWLWRRARTLGSDS